MLVNLLLGFIDSVVQDTADPVNEQETLRSF
jgi:hypothetical protein